MLPRPCLPCDIYRRVELDARVEGADGIGLTRLCLERALSELDRANRAYGRGDRGIVCDALTRAASSVAGLSRGVVDSNPMRGPLLHLYGAAETAIRGCVSNYREDVLERVKTDLRDIAGMVH